MADNVLAAFSSVLERWPERTALCTGDYTLSYEALAGWAADVAERLTVVSADAGPIGILACRGLELVCGQLASLYAGRAFVPLDPSLPKRRIAAMLHLAGVAALVHSEATAELAQGLHQRRVVISANTCSLAQWCPPTALPPSAYVIFTSGSSGCPKGVEVEHSALSNLCAWHAETFGVCERSRVTMLASVGFDASIWEIWPALTRGASVHVVPEPAILSTGALLEFYRQREISHSFVPTRVCERLLAEAPLPVCLLTGGEKLLAANLFGWTVYNCYGLTETTVVATSYRVPTGPLDDIPIGASVANTRVVVLDDDLVEVETGTTGEIIISGECLARGYLDRSLEVGRFFDHPTLGRSLRTGDRGRVSMDGLLYYVGRLDSQVQLRGCRVELEEVRAALQALDAVSAAAVVASGDGRPEKLVAYLECEPGLTRAEVRGQLLARLPSFMVPERILRVDALPTTASGKLDHAALSRISATELGGGDGDRSVTSQLAKELSRLFDQPIELEASAAANGLSSLQAIELAEYLADDYGRWIQPWSILTANTLAEAIDAPSQPWASPFAEVPRYPMPATHAQQRMWIDHHSTPDGLTYNEHYLVEVETDPGRESELIARLETRARELWHRHPPLRTAFDMGADGALRQRPVDTPLDWAWRRATEAEARSELHEDLGRQHDLEAGRLARVRVYELGLGRIWVYLAIHHIAVDGLAMTSLVEELLTGKPTKAPSYADFAAWERRTWDQRPSSASLEFWREELRECPPPLFPPVDVLNALEYRQEIFSWHGRQGFAEDARRAGVSRFAYAAGLVCHGLANYCERATFTIGVPHAGRPPGFAKTIGCFVNPLPVRVHVAPDDVRVTARRIAQSLSRIAEHALVPFDLVHALEARAPEHRAHALFDVLIVSEEHGPWPSRKDFGGGLCVTASPVWLAKRHLPHPLVFVLEGTASQGDLRVKGAGRQPSSGLVNHIASLGDPARNRTVSPTESWETPL